jgi:naringenin degradation protein FdeD
VATPVELAGDYTVMVYEVSIQISYKEMNSDKKKYLACNLDELKRTGGFGLEVDINGRKTQCFLIYHQNKVYSYLNSCPHTGVNLDWVPHQFLDRKKEYIQCSTHGALFNIDDGYCLRGPCVGDQLQIIENDVSKGNIYLIL